MTDKDGHYISPRTWFKNRTFEKVVDMVIGWFLIAILGGALMLISEGFRQQAQDIWHSPQTIKEAAGVARDNSHKLEGLARRVAVLSQPDVIFEVSTRNSGPVDGYCVEREPCLMRVRVRRVESALSCRLVPSRASWGFIDPATDTFASAQRLDTPAGRNIGASWTYIEVLISTPTGLAPESDFVFEAAYTDCPGMDEGDDPITRTSARIPVKVLDQKP